MSKGFVMLPGAAVIGARLAQIRTLTVEGMPREGPPCSCAATSSPPQTLGLPKQSTVCSTTVAS